METNSAGPDDTAESTVEDIVAGGCRVSDPHVQILYVLSKVDTVRCDSYRRFKVNENSTGYYPLSLGSLRNGFTGTIVEEKQEHVCGQ